jgi:RNA polymerase sigma factor (sigma-70 family)
MDEQREFPITSWSVVRQAARPGSPEYQRHLRRLVTLYWKPVYWVIRQGWSRSEADAKDLTQEFFATAVIEGALSQTYSPERGSFRALLRAAITNFMRNDVRNARRQKRGGDVTVVSWEEMTDGAHESADASLDDVPIGAGSAGVSPERLFDLAWSHLVMKRALALLETRLAADGKASAFEAFRRHDLDEGDRRPSYVALGEELGLTGPQVMHALRQARETFRCVVTEVVSEYAEGPEEIAREIQLLLGG